MEHAVFPNHHFSGWRNLSCQCSVHPHDVEIQHLTCRCMMNGTGLRRIFATQKSIVPKKYITHLGFLIHNRYFYDLGCCLQHFYHSTPQTKSIKKQRTSTCSTASQPPWELYSCWGPGSWKRMMPELMHTLNLEGYDQRVDVVCPWQASIRLTQLSRPFKRVGWNQG